MEHDGQTFEVGLKAPAGSARSTSRLGFRPLRLPGGRAAGKMLPLRYSFVAFCRENLRRGGRFLPLAVLDLCHQLVTSRALV
jgi:hypothetical protein